MHCTLTVHRIYRVKYAAWSVCLSVCPLVTTMSCAKTDEPITVSFGVWTRVGAGNQVLDGGPGPLGEEANFGGT